MLSTVSSTLMNVGIWGSHLSLAPSSLLGGSYILGITAKKTADYFNQFALSKKLNEFTKACCAMLKASPYAISGQKIAGLCGFITIISGSIHILLNQEQKYSFPFPSAILTLHFLANVIADVIRHKRLFVSRAGFRENLLAQQDRLTAYLQNLPVNFRSNLISAAAA